MPRPRKLSVDEETLLKAALEGLELQRQRLEQQIEEIRQRLSGSPARRPAKATAKRARRKRTLSPEARKRISEAQKKRWAEYHKKKGKQGA